ncbi:MAG: hypothetical protein HFH68_05020 [Lachnospiraceae bacterium]|nr:hypothetical protein [Lachnospiraceae bacterium]
MNKKVIAIGLALSIGGISAVNAQAKKITSSSQAEKMASEYVKGATVLFVEEDEDDGVWTYEVDMKKGSKKYELVYQASNGKLIEYKWEKTGHKKGNKKVSEKAIRSQAGKKVKNAKIIEVDYDMEDAEYEVELIGKSKKYELGYSEDGTLISYQWEKF